MLLQNSDLTEPGWNLLVVELGLQMKKLVLVTVLSLLCFAGWFGMLPPASYCFGKVRSFFCFGLGGSVLW